MSAKKFTPEGEKPSFGSTVLLPKGDSTPPLALVSSLSSQHGPTVQNASDKATEFSAPPKIIGKRRAAAYDEVQGKRTFKPVKFRH